MRRSVIHGWPQLRCQHEVIVVICLVGVSIFRRDQKNRHRKYAAVEFQHNEILFNNQSIVAEMLFDIIIAKL